ncbi:LPS export ABC transporter permease LptG [Castellaniella sp. S9]|uniref:LPS export ABC transporter permease LptG n=1 Tax=Castellaniella sp. S9 TaxID=2993652 RepID=UPI0022B42F3F|nr:LPS export ABC transporter permease LptG [Castellaniella sp. S9]
MRTARRYLAREIYRSTAVVLLALVGLFIFFALIEGLDKVGTRLTLLNLFYLQLLNLPTHLYELLPIGLLIGAVLALAGLAQRNELTILRCAGVSGMKLLGALWVITIPLVLGAFVLSEFITPAAELRGSESRLALLGRADGGRLESGYWFKESDDQGITRIINIRQLTGKGSVEGVILYELGEGQALRAMIEAESGEFSNGALVLREVTETHIDPRSTEALADARTRVKPLASVTHRPERSIDTSLTPERLIARVLTPERMSIADLVDYIGYLQKNHLQTDRQVIALWRKVAYPFTLLVMITIAAPIGFMQTRRGGVGPKVFAGIILGVGFFMLNQLALNAGMLGDWPPWATALVPNLASLGLALAAIAASEHRHAVAGFIQRHRAAAGAP